MIRLLRELVETYYDVQKTRIAIELRIKGYEREGRKDEIPEQLIDIYKRARDQENAIADMIREELNKLSIPIYTQWLSKIKGIGEVLAAQFIALVGDVGRFEHTSDLYSYAGYGLYDGQIQMKRRGTRIPTGSLKLKAVVHKIVMQMLMNKDPFYRAAYDYFRAVEERKNKPRTVSIDDAVGEYLAIDIPELNLKAGTIIKKRIAARLKGAGYDRVEVILSKAHIHMRALRKVKKLFLAHYFEVVRRMEGLPVDVPYSIARNFDAYIPPPYLPIGMPCLACEHKIPVNSELDWTNHGHT